MMINLLRFKGSIPMLTTLVLVRLIKWHRFDSFTPKEVSGLVVGIFAGRRMSEGMLAGLSELSRSGKIIVVTSRVPNG